VGPCVHALKEKRLELATTNLILRYGRSSEYTDPKIKIEQFLNGTSAHNRLFSDQISRSLQVHGVMNGAAGVAMHVDMIA